MPRTRYPYRSDSAYRNPALWQAYGFGNDAMEQRALQALQTGAVAFLSPEAGVAASSAGRTTIITAGAVGGVLGLLLGIVATVAVLRR